eukprot:TRINITY_DN9136_c0_g8_i2.p1 TRINITY_DN9136_c0_g8~~TRINITY_DN9136_c0_g8_i2.p1  ORF type:complete len:268 (+),score=50.56 TRINITY_DN9136_c0_g8_i2:69-872(+)
MDALVFFEAAMYLQMEDVARLRTVDSATREALELEGDESVWRNCAQNQCGDELFATYGLYARSQRQLCFKFHSMLSRAKYMLSCAPLIVHDLQEASLIERRLRNAVRVSSAHRAASGRDAKVLLGEFFLHDAGFGTKFRFGGDDLPSTLVGLPPGVLEIALCLEGGALMSCARYGVERDGTLEQCHEAARVQLTLNVDSAENEVFMSFHGMPLILDGSWRSSRCGCWFKRSAGEFDESVLCVLSLLDRQLDISELTLVNALNLETIE